MASCHARAVMLRRKEYQDEIDYNIALAVATHMGGDGRPATISLATIAEYAHCHYNTADRRVKGMTATGQLIAGRSGRYLAHSVPYDGDDGEPEGESAAVSEVAEIRLEVADLKEQVVELKEQVAQLTAVVSQLSHVLHTSFTRPSHVLHTSFTSIDEDNVSEVGKKGSSEELSPPTAAGGTERPKRSPKQLENDLRKEETEKQFSMITGLSVPKRATEKQRKEAAVLWWNPLAEMLELAGGDCEKFKSILTTEVGKMRGQKLTVSSPKSVIANFRSAVGASNGTSYGNGRREPADMLSGV